MVFYKVVLNGHEVNQLATLIVLCAVDITYILSAYRNETSIRSQKKIKVSSLETVDRALFGLWTKIVGNGTLPKWILNRMSIRADGSPTFHYPKHHHQLVNSNCMPNFCPEVAIMHRKDGVSDGGYVYGFFVPHSENIIPLCW